MGKKAHKSGMSGTKFTPGGEKLLRKYRKTILFNEKEIAAINHYCTKYKIASRSAFIRNAVIAHIMADLDENYPKLF